MSAIVLSMSMSLDGFVDKKVLFHGAAVLAQLALTAGLVDELEVTLVPVLLGGGRRLFDGLGPEHVEFERTRVLVGRAG